MKKIEILTLSGYIIFISSIILYNTEEMSEKKFSDYIFNRKLVEGIKKLDDELSKFRWIDYKKVEHIKSKAGLVGIKFIPTV